MIAGGFYFPSPGGKIEGGVSLGQYGRTTMEAVVQRIDQAHGKRSVLADNAGIVGGGEDALMAMGKLSSCKFKDVGKLGISN